MRLILAIVLATLFLAGVCSADALEHYPRPWETKYGEITSAFIVKFAWVNALHMEEVLALPDAARLLLWKDMEPVFTESHNNLEQLHLAELRVEYDEDDEIKADLERAADYKEKAEVVELAWKETFTAALPTASEAAGLYFGYWFSCVDSAFSALDKSAVRLNDLREGIREEQEKFKYGGVCDNDYSGPNSNYCAESIEDASCNYSGVWNSWPDFSWYPGCIREHWKKIALLERQLENTSAAYSQTVEVCSFYVKGAASGKTEADAEMARLDAQRLDLIYESGPGAYSSGAEGVNGAYAYLLEAKKKADSSLKAAMEAAGTGKEKWIKTCIVQSAEASAGYSFLARNHLAEEATDIVALKRNNAYLAIAEAREKKDFLSEEGLIYLKAAEEYWSRAEGSNALGEKYRDYLNCSFYANEALGTIGAKKEIAGLEASALFEEVGGLLKKAKLDGIDVESEEKIYNALLLSRPANSREVLGSVRSNIINAAKIKYGVLEGERKDLREKIALAKGKFDYLYSWFEAEECFAGDRLNYECAIGRLGEIKKAYADIRAELMELNAPELLAGALIVDAEERWAGAVLDWEGEAYLYVRALNPLDAKAESVKISVPATLAYRKTDVIAGAEKIMMVSSLNGKTEIYLANVSAYEDIWLVFKKSDIPCRTTSASEKAWGDPQGGAFVEETIAFTCDHDVESLDLGRVDCDGAVLDGVPFSAAQCIVSHRISKGGHTLKLQKYDVDAYSVEREAGVVNTIGAKTHVEYFVKIGPKRDMEYLVYLVSESGKGIEGLDVFSYSGEKVSEKTAYGRSALSFKIADLKEGKTAKVMVNYDISNAKEYVDSSIAHYEAMNLSPEEESLLSQAKELVLKNDYDSAYAKIEALAEKMRQEDRAYEKLLLKHNKLRDELEEKKEALSKALELAAEFGLGNGAIEEMEARLGEIGQALLLEVDRGSLASPLENFDMGWESRELTKISKELAVGEKQVKDAWIAAGGNDSALAEEIERIESANNKFDGTRRFDDAVRAYYLLSIGLERAERAKADAGMRSIAEKAALDSALEKANEIWERYNAEYSEAAKTHWEGLFPQSASELSRKIKGLGGRKDYARAAEEAGKIAKTMEDALHGLEEQEEGLYESTEDLFMGLREQMDEKDAAIVQNALETAAAYADSGQYVRAMKSHEGAVEKMQVVGKKQDGLLIIALTGLLVLGIIALYMLKGKELGGMLHMVKGREREYKKLKREPPA
ncbi:MAG: hypothetical protein QXH30_00245 [Candidatus Bilamarchaeaceae archaeon]